MSFIENVYFFIKSLFLFIVYSHFSKRNFQILFYYPAHFNRSAEGKNLFFSPLYDLCDKHNIDYLIIEEPVLFKSFKRNPQAKPFDLPLLTILLFRKIMPLKFFESFEHREWFIAKILRFVMFRNLHFNNIIVISNSMLGFFKGVEPKAKLYDYQHGVIYSNHSGYFTKEHKVAPHIKANDVNLLLHGKMFKEIIIKNDQENYYHSHAFVLGTPFNIEAKEKHLCIKKTSTRTIAFSLQFTDDKEYSSQHDKWLQIIQDFLQKNSNFFEEKKLKLVMKHHPRFHDSIDLSCLKKFSFVEFTNASLEDFLENAFLHLTFYSTTIFDAAARGIPTILWAHEYSLAHIFEEDFEYPLGITRTNQIITAITELLVNPEAYHKICENMREWYEKIYSPLDEDLFLKLFKKDES